jgi:hypothetical protein
MLSTEAFLHFNPRQTKHSRGAHARRCGVGRAAQLPVVIVVYTGKKLSTAPAVVHGDGINCAGANHWTLPSAACTIPAPALRAPS